MKKYLFSQKQLLGYIACNAIIQSPYILPDNLNGVLQKTAEDTAFIFKGQLMEIAQLIEQEIGVMLDQFLLCQFSVKGWNQRKNGNKAAYGFSSRHEGKADADNDFIDLGALRRNIINCFIFEQERNDAFELKREKSHKVVLVDSVALENLLLDYENNGLEKTSMYLDLKSSLNSI